MKRAACILLLGLSGAAMAKTGTPGPEYFRGTYERIGRDGGHPARLLNDLVTIRPAGQTVVIAGCTGPDIVMGFGPAIEAVNLMTGRQGPVDVSCLFHNNGSNRPVLTCRASDGATFTLWPAEGAAAEREPACD